MSDGEQGSQCRLRSAMSEVEQGSRCQLRSPMRERERTGQPMSAKVNNV